MTTKNMTEAEKSAAVLKGASVMLRTVSAERDGLALKLAAAEEKNATYERRTRAEKVAAQMHQKGIHTDIDFTSLAAQLEKDAMEGKLGTIEEAVEMVGPDMGLKTASINSDIHQASGSDLERFLTGVVG